MFAMYINLSLLSTLVKIHKYKSAMCCLSKKVIISPWLFCLASNHWCWLYISSTVLVTVFLGRTSHCIMYFHNTLSFVEKCHILFLQPLFLSHLHWWPNSPLQNCGDINRSQINKGAFEKQGTFNLILFIPQRSFYIYGKLVKQQFFPDW